MYINILKLTGYFMSTGFDIKEFYSLPTQYSYVSRMDLRGKKGGDYFAIQPRLIGFNSLDRVCLLHSMNWSLYNI
jgi:hypothetical protein